MREMAARCDLRACSFGRCWAPVLAPAALALLDAIEPTVASVPAARLLDAGGMGHGGQSVGRGGRLRDRACCGPEKRGDGVAGVGRRPACRPDPVRAAARAELLAAGFTDVEAWEGSLHYPFTRAEARALFVEYDRTAELDALAPAVRDAVVAGFAGLARLPDSALCWDVPPVAARAIRPRDD